jgi:hypothetical protein
MIWPSSQDYNEAVQAPPTSFSDPELRAGTVATNALGIPMPRSGNFADVYEVRCPNGRRWAVKCFTRPVPGLRERYHQISQTLLQASLPFTVEFQYLEQGILVRGRWYPVLKMRWVEGQLLNEFVRNNLDRPAVLGLLNLAWTRMARRLREARIAHGDLQHGNVLLVTDSTNGSLALTLIDYDGMLVPALVNSKSGEVGHPNYQHPLRLREGSWTPEVDRFPVLLVATALQALSVGGRDLWERYDNGDNLLFKERDLRAPGQSLLFRELFALPDSRVRALTGALSRACHGRLEETPIIEEPMPDPQPAAAATRTDAGSTAEAWWLSHPPTSAAGVTAPGRVAADVAVPAGSEWSFEGTASGRSSPRRSKRRGVVGWLLGWLAALGLVVVSVLLVALATRPKTSAPAEDVRNPEILVAKPEPEPPTRPAKVNGTAWDAELDCRPTSHRLPDLGPTFDVSRAWVLSLDVMIPDAANPCGLVFFIGDDRPGRDPLFVRQRGGLLEFAASNAFDNTGFVVAAPISPAMLGRWVPVIFRYNAPSRELELYVDGTLVARNRCPITPKMDRPMPVWVGSENLRNQRFHGKVRSVWLAND